jgi:putative ABC transport system permease protein
VPGVQEAAVVSYAPFTDSHIVVPFDIENAQIPERQRTVEMRAISPNYFRVLGMPIIEGRSFDEFDNAAEPAEAIIVNEVVAKRYWPNESPINKRLRTGSRSWTVIGVSGNVKEFGLAQEFPAMIYTPIGRTPGGAVSILIRCNLRLMELAPAIRHEIASIDKDLPIERISEMDELISASFASERYRTILISIFAVCAGALALIGLYGAMTRFVAYRTRELGIRIAVGATTGNILWLVLKQSASLTGIGSVIGLFGAVASARFVAGLLFEISALDISTYAGVAAALFVVALLASCWPAWKAANTDPIRALRVE